MKLKRNLLVLGIVFLCVLIMAGAYAQVVRGTAVRTNQGNFDPDLQRIYASELDTYWPTLSDPNSCFARQDLILQVPPGGCQPAVVRSDLLAEQDVPVFCQISALEINPLIDVEQIRNIRFSGNYPPEVAGVGFHPARAALQTGNNLIGSPLINNIGYVVLVLKQNEIEDELPDLVQTTLSAQIDYYGDNSFGVGNAQFLLEDVSEEEWQAHKNKQSFWQGRYFLKLEEADSEYAVVSIYHGDVKVTEVRVERGQRSHELFMPGFFCQAGLEVAYDGLETRIDETARLRIDDDIIEVSEGSRFLNNKCSVRNIDVDESGNGQISLRCGTQSFELSVSDKEVSIGSIVKVEGREGDWEILSIEGEVYNLKRGEEDLEVNVSDIIFDSPEELFEKSYDSETEAYFDEAIANYKGVAEEYGSEKDESGESFGEKSLKRAIRLSEDFVKQVTQAELTEQLLDQYPSSDNFSFYSDKLNDLYLKDSSLAGKFIEIDNKVRVIRLVELKKANRISKTEINWGTESMEVFLRNETARFGDIGELTVTRIISSERVEVSTRCFDAEDRSDGRKTLNLNDNSLDVCGRPLRLESVDIQGLAKVRLLPKVNRVAAESNFTVGIGIEKRNIQLNPEKTEERIEEIGNHIEQWESISNGLGNFVSGMKAACFATAGVLTVKNFFTGLSGEAIARQQVMRDHWNSECADLRVGDKTYSSVSQCYFDNRDKINADVREVNEALSETNNQVKGIEEGGDFKKPVEGLGSIFGETSVNTEGAAEAFRENVLLREYGSEVIDSASGETVNQVFGDASYAEGDFGYHDERDIVLNLKILESDASPGVKEGARRKLQDIAERVDENKEIRAEVEEANADNSGLPGIDAELSGRKSRDLVTRVVDKESVSQQVRDDLEFGEEVTKVSRVKAASSNGFDGGVYILGTDDNGVIREVYRHQSGEIYSSINVNEFSEAYGVAFVKPASEVSYSNEYLNPEIKYYETEPYKGMPAIVPFDVQNGWYAATEQDLPVFGGIGSFESSGRVVSFWLCNVGQNGRQQFFEGIGDDQCQLINLNTGQALNMFPGLSEAESREKIARARQAIIDAARGHEDGVRNVNVLGRSVSVGAPAANVIANECQTFMSPEDCQLLFNVCDPVVCPSSRCDLGGAFPVNDVVQTGVVGSALLCLPNVREGIAVPVCLTGIKAGVDSYLSILKSHQQCLQENIDTGRNVGICDEITSVYTCEFFWRQAAPASKVLLPKIFEVVTGQTAARGGGEYANVASAFDNAEKSVDFFTQTYAVNSLEAFQIRSVEEAGSQVCRAFISGAAPTSFETLVEPDSPPQFHAWFSSIRFSDATVPATAQYKVFYHIFAGNDQGVHYSVYIKDPPASSFYQNTPIVPVVTGFIPRGEFATETIDLTAPEGYKQLCVRINNEEECGFKQVSTSFALDYVRDEFVSNEIKRRDITSEQSCISGEPLNPTGLLNPNLQEAFEEGVTPQVFERGVVRVCATENPGLSTDPLRFEDVGHCGNERVRCWLDKESIDRALSSNLAVDEGLKNETLSRINEVQKKRLEEAKEIITDPKIEVDEIESEVDNLDGRNIEEADDLINKIEETFLKVYFNRHKAELIFLKGWVNEKVAFALREEIPVVRDSGEATVNASTNPGVVGDPNAEVGQEGQGENFGEGFPELGEPQPTTGQGFPELGEPEKTTQEKLDEVNEAIEEFRTKTGDYSENSEAVDELLGKQIITEEQHEDISGTGLFNLQESMAFVRNLLLQIKVNLEREFRENPEPEEIRREHIFSLRVEENRLKIYYQNGGEGEVRDTGLDIEYLGENILLGNSLIYNIPRYILVGSVHYDYLEEEYRIGIRPESLDNEILDGEFNLELLRGALIRETSPGEFELILPD